MFVKLLGSVQDRKKENKVLVEWLELKDTLLILKRNFHRMYISQMPLT